MSPVNLSGCWNNVELKNSTEKSSSITYYIRQKCRNYMGGTTRRLKSSWSLKGNTRTVRIRVDEIRE